jgi:predicted 3-demethylubiquinone-9 3-methyltransferase (glyoxalase superfamily)
MSKITQRITNCLWFDTQAQEAAAHYTSIFKNSSIGAVTLYTKEGFEFHRMPEGSVMTVSFNLDGQNFVALNGGPIFEFNEAISLMVNCESQEEVDYYWYKLSEGGKEGQCGWLTDKFGVSWQIIVPDWTEMVTSTDEEKVKRLYQEVFKMKKPDLQKLKDAFEGN